MYIIVLQDELKIGKIAETVEAGCLIAALDFPDVATHCFYGDKKGWAHYSRLDLQLIIRNHGQTPGNLFDYSALLAQVVEIANSLPVDKRKVWELERLADKRRIPEDTRPIEKAPRYMELSAPTKGLEALQRGEEGEAPPKAPSHRSPPQKGATGRVWEIADNLIDLYMDKTNIDLKELRRKVIAACEAEGLNPGTAGTQFAKWKKDKGL